MCSKALVILEIPAVLLSGDSVQHAPRCVPVTLQKEVKENMSELEKKGIIQKVAEPIAWISSMVLVSKPGKIKICLAPRDLNKAIQTPKDQMPTLEAVKYSPNSAKRRFLPPSMSKMAAITRLD